MLRIGLLSLAILCLPLGEVPGQHVEPTAFRDRRELPPSVAPTKFSYAPESRSKGQWVATGFVVGAVAGGATLGLLMADRIADCDGACVAGDWYVVGAIGVGALGGGALGAIIASLLHSRVSERGTK